MRRILLFLVAFASLAIAPIATSHAQDLITPTWTKSSSAGLVGVSKNGAVLLSTNGAIIRAWSTATQKLLAIVPVFADSTTPANDGSGFYYTIGSPGRVYKFTFATQTTSLIHTEPANYQTAQRITMSNDGTRLAFKAFNTTTSRHNIVVCDATTGVTANRWPIPGGADTQQISFVNNDQKICLGGLRLYTVTGTLVATALSFPINTFAVSPNTDIIYGQEQVNGRLIAYNVSSGLNWMWSTFDPSNISAGFKVSSDGNTLISSGQDDEDSLFGLESYSTYDGLSLNKFPATSDTTISSFALHPTTNTVFYWDPLDYSLKKNTYSVNGTQLTGAVFSEYSGGGEKIQMVGTSANPKIALDDNSSNYTNLFNANTGGSPFVIGVSSAVFSPDGTHYLWIGFHTTYGLHVYRVSDNVKVGTYTSNDVENAGWGSNGKVWAYRNTGRVRCFDFTGAALNLINDWAGPTSANLCMSSSGARLAWTNGNGITIYNVNNAATVGVLNPGSNGEPFSVRFCGNSLAVHDIEEQGTVFTNRLRIFDVTSAAFPILRQASYDMGALHDDHGAARVSDDQSIAVFVRGTGNLADGSHGSDIRVFRMWDGAQLRKYDNQFGDFSF